MKTTHLCLIVTLCLSVHRSSSDVLRRQKRNWIIDSFTIDEGYKGPFPYVLGKIELERNLTVFKIKGQGVDLEPKNTLEINEHTGEIFVLRPVNYEEFKVIKLEFLAFNKEKKVIDTRLGIEIVIIDANDNAPKFDPAFYEVSIKESTEQGIEIVTFMATDEDSSEGNGKFDFRIASVTPEPHDLEFILTGIQERTGSLTFNGCLDHETAEKYTIIVEAKDRGKDVQLSSSCTIVVNIEDGNNHMPDITGETDLAQVKERETNVLVKRMHVTDKDTKGTAAWRAVYEIHGDANDNFEIHTDPETNDGLLNVKKPIDFEDSPEINLTISVKNEIPYHLCKVVERSSTGLWTLEVTSGGSVSGAAAYGGIVWSTRQVTVTVIDVNDPPSFMESNKKVKLSENQVAGRELATFTAKDPDIIGANTIVYKLGYDPAGWVTVDPVTGKVTTAKSMDRESSYVEDNIYAVTVLAIDNGNPQMTSTATLSIYITDENDNSPVLARNTFDMCQTDSASMINITVSDLDEDPYGGPFHFKLRGDVENMWRVEPDHGYSVNLVKDSSVHSGEFELLLEVSDNQHKTTVHDVSVTVCNCLDVTRPNCRSRREISSGAGVGALGAIFICLLLFAVAFMALFMLSCKEERKIIKIEDEFGQHLIKSYTEAPGSDCKVPFEVLSKGDSNNMKSIKQIVQPGSISGLTMWESQDGQSMWGNSMKLMHLNTVNQVTEEQYQFSRNSMYRASERSSAFSTMGQGQKGNYSMHRDLMTTHSKYSAEAASDAQQTLAKIALTMMLQKRELEEAVVRDYPPHIYATEEDTETRSELSLLDIPADPDLELALHQDQHAKFSTLVSICTPGEDTAYSAKTSCAEKHEWKVENEHWHKTQDVMYQTSDFKYKEVHSTCNMYTLR